jgi:hypothetical protein
MKTTALLLLVTASIAAVTTASADTIYWTDWVSNTTGSIVPPHTVHITVTYSGELSGLKLNYPSWNPSTTFADTNIVDNAPPKSGHMVRLGGGGSTVNTITFSRPVVNPVFSIWSLGAAGIPAKFEFINATPVFLIGGPSVEYGGAGISVAGNTVSGNEGNGTIRFLGTYSSISWKNELPENYYGFTVGVPAQGGEKIPEPPIDIREVPPTVEWKCFDSFPFDSLGVCIDNRIVKMCWGGNPDYCFDIPPKGGGPGCIRCLLGASAAVGAALGVGGTVLWVRRKRLSPTRDISDDRPYSS